MSEETKQTTQENKPVEAVASVEVAKKEKAGKGKKVAGVKKTAKGKKKKIHKLVPVAKAFIKATYNNTIVTITDSLGNVLSWSSAGINGFKGPKKATPYAASVIVKDAVDKAESYGIKDVAVYVKGVGMGRESAIRAFNANGFNITAIKDITPIPHNGCRQKKPRRV